MGVANGLLTIFNQVVSYKEGCKFFWRVVWVGYVPLERVNDIDAM